MWGEFSIAGSKTLSSRSTGDMCLKDLHEITLFAPKIALAD